MGKFAVSQARAYALSQARLGAGSVVLVTFPFSNLKGQKVRPALVLANVEFGNFILCQITSKSYTSKMAVRIKPEDFAEGNLPVVSYVRPDKLFTADATIIKRSVGTLTPTIKNKILRRVSRLFT